MRRVSALWFSLFIVLSVAVIARSDEDCIYTAFIRTGSIFKAGTDSIMSLKLYDDSGYGVKIKDLEAWGGLMGPDYNYFERGNLDFFSGRGPCLTGPICAMNLTSDGSGAHHFSKKKTQQTPLSLKQRNHEVSREVLTPPEAEIIL